MVTTQSPQRIRDVGLLVLFILTYLWLPAQSGRQFVASQTQGGTVNGGAGLIEQLLLEKLLQANPTQLSQSFRPSLLPPLSTAGGSGGGKIIIQPAYSLGKQNSSAQRSSVGQSGGVTGTRSGQTKANPTASAYQTLPLRSGTAAPGTQQVIRGGNLYDIVPPKPSQNQYDKVTQPFRSGTTSERGGGYESIRAPLNGAQPAASGQVNRSGGYESVRSPLAANKTASTRQLQTSGNTGYGILPNRRTGNGYESASAPLPGNAAKSGNTLPYLKTPLSFAGRSSQAATGGGVTQSTYDKVPTGPQKNTYGVVPPARSNSNRGYESTGSPLGGSSSGTANPYQQLPLRSSSQAGITTAPVGKQGGNSTYGVVPPARSNSNRGYESTGSPLGGSISGATGYDRIPAGKPAQGGAYGVLPPKRSVSNGGYESVKTPLGNNSKGTRQQVNNVGTTIPSKGAPATIASPQQSAKGRSAYGPLPKRNSNSSSNGTPGNNSSTSGAAKKFKSQGKR